MASEVARLRQQIEAECKALRLAMYGYAVVSSHKAISHRYRLLDRYRGQLATHVGEEQATDMMNETYNQIVR
jgi:hypothetical protein